MTEQTAAARPLRIAIVGAGPAGIYAADALMKSDADVSIDLYERMPAPFGLIRYGVAPDHPRIKGIITALHKVLDKPQVRLLGNIDYGSDITLDDLRVYYDAVIFSTGANADRALPIPGIDLDGSYGAADFVSWYDGHPDVPRTWPLDAEKVAVLGVGNVALDIARVLAKTGDELLPTEIPPNVYKGLKENKAVEVHVFGRRGPAQAKFTPLELRELDHSPTIEVIVDPEDIDYDEGSEAARRHSKQVDMVANTLEQWAIRDQGNRPHRLYLHFFESPAEVIGDENGKVIGLKTERTQLDGTGNVKGTGEYKTWDVQAVYRAVGYLSQNISNLPFDDQAGVVPNEAGRVLADEDADGPARYMPATYVTGWIKRGPVGLIGHTKGDANETVACLLDDSKDFTPAQRPEPEAVIEFLEGKGIPFTTWDGWYRLDAHERALGEPEGRERVKVVEREDMLRASEPHKV
ncbi:FAD-dependent oxidoreductase [Nocardia cyriacigeorgica]|jgi:ferredoxin/flavodoxin---NADP+ reductase|uniref:ferredoxin--NADP(+) reductase n=1 Tax=Nocardia cyriacigeorgica TaxID=135487 RepID=A0A2L2JPP6_9NOCA|nr:FAD-dependent oxidoreductase [Nocardia cyriacigeorgica]AVH21787.1 pyridine nucleotide-disulfide oxidoreductase [Nocardia cyriacigeorgica]MBF6085719.1 FAD-dependent oxidoreductase [Nocardia cyriacigeorgica]MBF6091810.1 FAD-dependent oxidoreductase [Nocardia cyriacigeorgica]MBF6321285.1 FAD-dependent oxidoreductase [Nocardia cyriacigeorgica]MBF6495019.1 FAD-dependent oxidoreductase [Nocardia cyriacigeorgica]